MTIAIGAQKDTLANSYATAAPYGALFTSDPGTSGSASGEATGGSPAYNRKALSWSTASGGTGVTTGGATFDVASGTTVTFFAVASSVTPGAATLRDKVAVTSQAFASQGTYTVTVSYTQT